MRTKRFPERVLSGSPSLGYAISLMALACWVSALPGCAVIHREYTSLGETWDHAVELRFPSSETAPSEDVVMKGAPEYQAEVVSAPDWPSPTVQRMVRAAAAVSVFAFDNMGMGWNSRQLIGVPDRGDTKYTIIPGSYAFEFAPERIAPVWGEMHLYQVSTPRARDFIRHTSLNLTPSPDGHRSVLSQSDIDRARSGDVVTKVVFMADLGAIRDRLDKIDRGQRELARLRGVLEEQEAYWARKANERRLNTRYSSEFGWGVDVPATDLALLQALVGPERYHWHRYSEADDQLRTHREMISQLDLPDRRLSEEQAALKQIMSSITVIHRSDDLVIMSESMIRPYKDPVREVSYSRGGQVWADYYRDKIVFEDVDYLGALGRLYMPYGYSGLANGLLSPSLRALIVPSSTITKNIGQVLMVVQAGSRRPPELGGHSWVGTQ